MEFWSSGKLTCCCVTQTGVLPLYEQFGEPVPGQYNQVEEVPEHIVGYREECNRGNKEYAEEAARKEPPVRGKEREEE